MRILKLNLRIENLRELFEILYMEKGIAGQERRGAIQKKGFIR